VAELCGVFEHFRCPANRLATSGVVVAKNGERYFVHCKQFREKSDERVLTDGAMLEFEAGVDREGRPYAEDIVLISAPNEDDVLFERLCAGDLRDANLDGGHRRPRKRDRDKKKKRASASSSFTNILQSQ